MLQNGPNDVWVCDISDNPQRPATAWTHGDVVRLQSKRLADCEAISQCRKLFSGAAQESGAVIGCCWAGNSDGIDLVESFRLLRGRWDAPGTIDFLNGELGAKTP